MPLLQPNRPSIVPEAFIRDTPLARSGGFEVHHLPPGANADTLLTQANETARALSRWLGPLPSAPPTRIIVLSPDSDAGKAALRKSRTRHQATGYHDIAKRLLVVVGNPDAPRFEAVLRHECGHATLRRLCPAHIDLPFWLEEGIATLFEISPRNDIPAPNIERQALLEHQAQHGQPLNLETLIHHPFPRRTTGVDYAQAWGLMACLYADDRSVSTYISALARGAAPTRKLFYHHLLHPDETPEELQRLIQNFSPKP